MLQIQLKSILKKEKKHLAEKIFHLKKNNNLMKTYIETSNKLLNKKLK